MSKIGFTGTRNGMSEAQIRHVRNLILNYKGLEELHHGDCVGADTDFHEIGRDITDAKVIIHPPVSNDLRAFNSGDFKHPPLTHFARNRNIVDSTDILIATPPANERLTRGGTWYTIDYSTKVRKKCYVCYPDGRIEVLNKPEQKGRLF